MEEDQEQEHINHVCKFCTKSFPCGRSLGGHMRSHHVTNFSAENEKMKKLSSEEASSGYGLRENPKKTWRLTDSSEEKETSLAVVLDKVCKECGKGFQSWKALFGHMKCHSDKEKVILNDDDQEDSWNKIVVNDSQSDDDDDVNVPNRRRRRSKRKKTRYMKTTTITTTSVNSSSVSVSEIQYEHDDEQVAVSLMMLSRDVSNWCGLNSIGSSNSLHLEKTVSKIEGKKVISNCSEIEKLVKPRDKNNKSKIDSESTFEVNGEELVVSKKAKFFDSEKKSNLSEKSKKSHKKGKFECTTCKKIFHSYQALGGHRASHKRNKGCFFATKNENSENTNEFEESSEVIMKNIEKDNIENVKEEDEELVGDLESQSQSVMVEESLPEIRNFLDLNLPATTTDEENNGHQYGENYKPWWFIGSNHKQEGLLGLLTN